MYHYCVNKCDFLYGLIGSINTTRPGYDWRTIYVECFAHNLSSWRYSLFFGSAMYEWGHLPMAAELAHGNTDKPATTTTTNEQFPNDGAQLNYYWFFNWVVVIIIVPENVQQFPFKWLKRNPSISIMNMNLLWQLRLKLVLPMNYGQWLKNSSEKMLEMEYFWLAWLPK